MKRTFLAKRNALLTSTDLSWGALALAGVIIVLLVRLLAPNVFWQIFAPVFRGADALATKSHVILSSFGDTAVLTLRNEQLMSENAALMSEKDTLLKRVESQDGLFRAPERSIQGIVAGVIARPPESPYDTLILSLGSNEGVTLGQEAFGKGGVPLGIVSSVLPDFSRVTLFSAANLTVQGWVGSSHVPLIIFGSGAGVMRGTSSRSAGASVGDTVFVSGPGPIPVGTVTRIDSDPSSPAVTLHIQPTLNLFSVTWVELRDTGSAFASTLSWATSTLP